MENEETGEAKNTQSARNAPRFGMMDADETEAKGADAMLRRLPYFILIGGVSLGLMAGVYWLVRQFVITPPKKLSRVVSTKLQTTNRFGNHELRVFDTAFSPDGKLLATASADHTIEIFKFAESSKPLHVLTGHDGAATAVAFSPDSKMLASGSDDRTVKLWDAESGKEIAVLPHRNGAASSDEYYAVGVKSIAFSPDGKLLASGGTDGNVILWNVETKQIARVLEDSYIIWSIAFSPDGKTLASAGEGGGISLWNAESGQLIRQMEDKGAMEVIYSIAFAANGATLASGMRDGKVLFWDVDKGNRIFESAKLTAKESAIHENAVVSVAFAPKNMLLASGSYDGTTKFWNAETGAVLETLKLTEAGRSFKVCAVSFSPDGKILAVSDAEGKTLLYEVTDEMR